ncbi:IclR family transcriptional regulator [Ramlibacter sp. AN1015]|uniref:IclR family transcriptional regulator n=1 Tax=Ramlibacter sp. AN1015 TaxID=3133428 RepID=UPI0030C4D9A0
MAALTRNQVIAAAAGTLEVLEALGRAEGPMTLARLVQATGRPKGTVHRMVSTLVNTGFATYSRASGTYALTLKAWWIGSSALRDFDLVHLARPTLDRLRSESGETVHLAVLEPSAEIVYVAKVVSPKSIAAQTRLGKLSPSWCTATGRSLLAHHAVATERVLSEPLEQRTPRTVTDVHELRRLLARVRHEGYAVTRGENHPEMGGIAAPIRDHTGEVVASVGVAMPIYRMTAEVVRTTIPHVQQAADTISRDLGYRLPAASGARAALQT